MKIAFIKLPNIYTPVDGPCTNLHGYWNPPNFVLSFWSNMCSVEYVNQDDYNTKVKLVEVSYTDCVMQHYRDNSL